MKKLLTSDKIYIGRSPIPNAGRGVFAGRNIKKGEIVEICPLIEIPEHDLANLKESTLVTYFFYFGKNKNHPVVALGFGSIYNHSYEPNAKYIIRHSEKTLDFVASANIKKDDEITVSYNPKPKNKDPLWFKVV